MQYLAGGDNNRTPAKEQSSTNQASTVWPLEKRLEGPEMEVDTLQVELAGIKGSCRTFRVN